MKLIGAAVVVATVLIVLWTSYYTVAAESEGVVLRFGKFLKTVEPGLHFKLPLGIDEVSVLPTRRQLKLEFGFYTAGYSNADQPGREQVEEKSMVTGDFNAALVEWVVQYRIDDPKEYLFDVRNPGQTLRDLSEAAMREVIGDRTVDEVITIGRQDIEISALTRMQELAKRYKLGVRVDQVQLKNVNPPRGGPGVVQRSEQGAARPRERDQHRERRLQRSRPESERAGRPDDSRRGRLPVQARERSRRRCRVV